MIKGLNKMLFLGILSVVTVAVIVVPFSVYEKVSAITLTQSAVRATFNTPLSVSEVIDTVKKYGVKPMELHYTQGDIQGGYTIHPGENIETAMKNFLNAHRTFFSIAITNADRDINNALLDEETHQRLSVLRSQLILAQSETDSGNFKVDEIETIDEQSLGSLRKAGFIKSLTPIQKGSRKSQEESGLNYIGTMSLSHEPWAPYGGSSDVQKTYTYQTFYFNNISSYGSSDTYEHETQVYDKNFANYSGYWSSNMPSKYYDTPFLDSIDNFTIGTFTGSSLRTYTQYYAYMSLSPGSASTAIVRIKGQKGHRYPSWCYSTWCVYPDATTGSMATFTAPAGMSWQY